MNQGALHMAVNAFRRSFHPPAPHRGKSGKNWLISGVWSDYMRSWLSQNFEHLEYEYPHRDRLRLDAALWFQKSPGPMEIALEWEWDHKKVHEEFAEGDFRKVLEVNAGGGLAIVHTRVDGNSGLDQANEVLENIRLSHGRFKRDNRPVGLIEVRRITQSPENVQFVWTYHDLNARQSIEGDVWSYP